MPFNIGETVGPYRITDQLGQGGMATVYKAYHANLDRYVAIKVLHPSFKEDETFFIRFKREAQIVARLEHQNIVPVYDFSEVGEPYLVMKFIEGQTLKHRFRRNPLTLDDTLRIMGAVAQALTYAHNQGVLHRDMKPSNVMLDKDENPYLTDFGLARIATTGESTMSQDVLIGTPHYISPEQAKGIKNLGPETDIYSMGIMLYEIVVGRVPFSADTPYAIVHDHIYKPLPIPSKVNPTVPPQIEMVLLKALAKEPADRYSSAVAMLNAFKDAVEDSSFRELSATSVRMEAFEEYAPPPDETVTATEDGRVNAFIRVVSKQPAQPQASTVYHEPAIQGVVPAPPTSTASMPMGIETSEMRRMRQKIQARRNFWVLSGVVALIFICIASLAVVINALQQPVLANQPQADEETVTPQATINSSLVTSMSIEEAEDWVADQPNDPTAHLTLAMAYFQAGDLENSNARIAYVLGEMNPSATVIAQAAQVTADAGSPAQAIFFWFTANTIDPNDADIRNNAGSFIYDFIQANPTIITTEMRLEVVRQFPKSPLVKVMIAHLLLTEPEDFTPLRQRSITRRLEQALALDSDFAEVHLIYGNYYAKLGDATQAQESWRFASSFADAPEWVIREANRQLQDFR